MRKLTVLMVSLGMGIAIVSLMVAGAAPSTRAAVQEEQSRLCVVWSSGDPGVAKNVCFMYTHAAKRAGWFDTVHLVVWGPSAKLLAENEELQASVKKMQESGVAVEACIVCANNYDVADALKSLGIDVKPMGAPLTQRLKGPWSVITF